VRTRTVLILLLLAIPLSAAPLPAKRVTGPDFTDAKQPQITVTEDGILHVAFGRADAIYTIKSQDGGVTFTPPVQVGRVEKLALGMRRGPRIATVGQAVVITAISHGDGNLYSWRSEDQGRTWSQPLRVNDTAKSATEGLHAFASGGGTKLIAVWLDLRNGKTELWTSASEDVGKSWAENSRVYRSPDQSICECCHPNVIFTPAGEIVAMWRNSLHGNRDMYRAASSDGGKSFSNAAKVGTESWKLAGCPMDGGSLASCGKNLSYAWRREGKLYFTTDSNAEHLLTESGTHPVVICAGNEFGYVWQDQGNLYWKTAAAKDRSLLAEGAGFAAAESSKDGSSVVVWEGQGGLYFSRFSH
jgi:hypothetical protein